MLRVGGSLYCGVQAWICALSAFSGFLFGYDLCVMVIALPLIQQNFGLSTACAESIVSTLMLGAVFGSLGGGVVADWIGRKPANLVTAVLFFAGSAFMTFAGSVQTLLVGRFVAGLAVGSSGPCVSVYVAETAHPDIRGTLVTINEVMVCFGCLVSIIVGGALEDLENGWRKILSLTMIPPIIQLIGMPFLPESPRWLQIKSQALGDARERKHLLFDGDLTEHDNPERQDVQTFLGGVSKPMRELVVDETTRRRILYCVMVAFCHILTGANAMLYYSTYILDALRTDNSETTSKASKEIWIAIAKLAGVCLSIFAVDRVGRRPLLLLGTSCMFFSHLGFAVTFWCLNPSSSGATLETIGTWNLYFFIFMWNLSWSPLMWVVCSEVLPDSFRSKGMGATFAVFWMGSALVNQTLLTVFEAIGVACTFLLYSTLTAFALAFVVFKVPETMGLSLEDIAGLFRRRQPHIALA